MHKHEKLLEIQNNIRESRNFYSSKYKGENKFFDILSTLFWASGFFVLLAAPFTELTIFHATAVFIISYVISPTDGDRYEEIIKGIAEDVGHIRALLQARYEE